MPLAYGQGSGDFRETSGRVQIFHVGHRNAMGLLTTDAFTQANPCKVTTAANVSTTLSGISKSGVLGASFAFTRADGGNGYIGGPYTTSYVASCKPLGLFINDAVGNAYENTPGVASNRGPYLNGMAVVGVSVYETQTQAGGGAALTYAVGDALYASVNGLITNLRDQSNTYEGAAASSDTVATVIGVLKVVPDANNSLMVLDMRI